MRLSSPPDGDIHRMRHYTQRRLYSAAGDPGIMPIELALYQPDIAQNTGTLIRLGACLGVPVHVIHPTGFTFTERTLRRSGLDYLEFATVIEHTSFAAFDATRCAAGQRLLLLTTKATDSAYAAAYAPGDILLLGRESAGVPDAVAASADLRLRIPMRPGLRSINVALAATLVLGEAMRQTNSFKDLN
ncbi:MAG: tRNA ((34)-2-O)-methyltransferase [Devosia sp.]|nr:tRNA ((34)-2-O)-methyltransferase [Devosia sp.]